MANLSTLGTNNSISFLTQVNTEGGSSTVSLDNDTAGVAANNNRFLDVNRANAKALGLLAGADAGVDATITFNSAFLFDFDTSDGITGHDFVGVAIHEIGHSLGFVSGVDVVDAAVDGVTGVKAPFDAPFDVDQFAVYSVLDMFRYSADGSLNLAFGGTPYFSIDGGTTSLGTFSTGSRNGDGRQASHWKDSLGLGIMDPTFAAGELGVVSGLDLQAFDVIGYTLIPEPAIGLLGVIGGLMLIRRRRW